MMFLGRFRARESRQAGIAANVAKTLGQIVVFWGFFLFVMPAAISWCEAAMGWDEYRFS